MSPFVPKLAALPARTGPAIAGPGPEGFVLYGGTALALRLGHRQSVDFDFFTSRTFSPTQLRATIPFLKEGTIAQGEPNTFFVWVRPLPRSAP